MTPEELYKKEFGNAKSVPKKSVIRLLNHFAKVLEIKEKKENKHKVKLEVIVEFSSDAYDEIENMLDEFIIESTENITIHDTEFKSIELIKT